MVTRWISYWFPQRMRHVGMFNTALPECSLCRGTGWFPNYPQRCMSSCSCVKPYETVTGND